MELDARCLVGQVVNRPTTVGTIGPLQTPVSQDLYEYLLDRPVVTAALVERFGMGSYRFTARGPGRFWVEDGDGTEGLITLLHHDGGFRVYHVEGEHHGHIFTSVHATAAVFMKIEPAPGPGVSTSLISFARLHGRFLAGLVWLLKPLLEDAITRKLTRGFEVTYLLGQRIAQEPGAILEAVPSLPFESQQEAQAFVSLLNTVPQASLPSTSTQTP
jgi:hypothetical protein